MEFSGFVLVRSPFSIYTPKCHINGCVRQDVKLLMHPVNYIHSHVRTPNAYRRALNTLGTLLPARVPLVALPHIWTESLLQVHHERPT